MPPKNIVILRPGALGDILVCRHLLSSLKATFPEARLTFVAPGERGKLLARFHLADTAMDWENAAFAWLFSADAESAPPPLLQALFTDTEETLVLVYLDLKEEEARRFESRLAALNPRLSLFLSPSRPPENSKTSIGEWLTKSAFGHCRLRPGRADADLVTDAVPDGATLVIHPGSGSEKKNWPLPSFAALAALLTEERAGTGLKRIRILAGEADAALGETLAALLPNAELIRQPPLAELVKILAAATLYIGNDSGVTHLAAAVRTGAGHKPKVAAVFGPSNPDIWAAPGTLTLRADAAMAGLVPESALAQILQAFFPGKT